MKKQIVVAMFALNVLCAKELDMQVCMALLGGGMHNSGLEDFCGFKGNLSDEMKAIYSDGKCRHLVPQSEVDRLAKETAEVFSAAESNGKLNKYCREHKKSYYEVLSKL